MWQPLDYARNGGPAIQDCGVLEVGSWGRGVLPLGQEIRDRILHPLDNGNVALTQTAIHAICGCLLFVSKDAPIIAGHVARAAALEVFQLRIQRVLNEPIDPPLSSPATDPSPVQAGG